jgi:hypothetical protein
MESFEELLKRWNRGIMRGAQLRFSKAAKVNQVTVGRWIRRELLPGERVRPRVAAALGITVPQLMKSFGASDAVVRERGPAYGEPSPEVLMGHINQLTKQIADLQAAFGQLRGEVRVRLDSVEAKVGEKKRSKESV